MIRRCFSYIAIPFALMLLLILIRCSRDNRMIAQIGTSERITAGEFEESLSKQIESQKPDTVTIEFVRDRLDDLIEERLILLAAYESGMDQDSIMQEKIQDFKRRTLIDMLWQKEVVDFVVSEKDIRDFYAKSDIQVDGRKIEVYVDARADSAEEAAALEKAEDLIRKAKEGQSFSRLARQYSDDRRTARKGGRIDPLWYQLGGDPVIEAAFSMKKGEISEPIRTRSGYTILMVDDVQEVNKRSYEEAYDGMKQYILNVRQDEAQQRAKAYLDTLWKERNAEWNEETIDTLTTLFRRWKKGHNQMVLIDSLAVLPEDFKNRKIFTSQKHDFTVADLREYYRTSLARFNRLAMENKSSFRRVLLGELQSRLLVDQAVRDRLDQSGTYRKQMKEKIEKELLRRKRSEIRGQVTPDKDEIRAYYEENKADKYMIPKKAEIREIQVRSEDLADELLGRIRAGENFGEMAEKYTIRKGYNEKQGLLRPFAEGAMGEIGRVAFGLSEGQIAGPIQTDDNRHSIIKLVAIHEAEPRPYKEVQGTVRRDYMNHVMNRRMAAWVAEQREARGVHVNEDLLESIRKDHADAD